MNTKKFKIMLFLCIIGVVGCNKVVNPSYMDGDELSKKGKGRQKISKSSDDSVPGTSSTSGKKPVTGSNISNSTVLLKSSLLIAEKEVERAKENFKKAQSMKDRTDANVQSSVQSNSDVSISQRLTSIVKNSDTVAAKSLLVAKERVRRAEENRDKICDRISKDE